MWFCLLKVILKRNQKRKSIATNLLLVLENLDQKAEERELKWTQLVAEIEKKRWEKEQ